MSEKKKNGGALLGAAFLMATSAIGPGFLTQTSKFTSDFQASFGFVILISILLSAVAQMNIWRVLCVTGLRGQEVANKVLPGLGYLVAFMVVLGGLVFNIGNVGGGAALIPFWEFRPRWDMYLPEYWQSWYFFPEMQRAPWTH